MKLTIDFSKVGQRPYGPVLGCRCVHASQQTEDGFEGAVIYVTVRAQVPTLDTFDLKNLKYLKFKVSENEYHFTKHDSNRCKLEFSERPSYLNYQNNFSKN